MVVCLFVVVVVPDSYVSYVPYMVKMVLMFPQCC